MSLKSFIGLQYARIVVRGIRKDARNALSNQEKIFKSLLKTARSTEYGKDHRFERIGSYEDFKRYVPLGDYEVLRQYIERTAEGEPNVLWPGKPLFFAKTSGTTSGVKMIPITRESARYHVRSAMQGVFCYLVETGNADVLNGKLIFLSGSPKLKRVNGIFIGRLSGIVNHMVPKWLKRNQVPSWKTNTIDDWEEKVEAIARETIPLDMRLISGIPAWVQMYFEKVLEKTGRKAILDVFPNFSIFVYGGVNFEPYKARIFNLIGKEIPSIETYPASEGFIAYQDSQSEPGMLLLTNNGVFYEFVPTDSYFSDEPVRLQLKDVEVGVNYALIMNTNAGLWGYSIGDTIKFVSKNPYRIVVTGRIKHFISAFGEHVIAEEVDAALTVAATATDARVAEFHVAPQVAVTEGLPYHEWLIEFSKEPEDMDRFRELLDDEMRRRNIYYDDLISGNILQKAVIRRLSQGAFISYMKGEGKLGGQNKVPRLMNDRGVADKLTAFVL